MKLTARAKSVIKFNGASGEFCDLIIPKGVDVIDALNRFLPLSGIDEKLEFASKYEWVSVSDDLPTTNEVVLVKFESVLGTIERCTAKFHMVPRHAFENPPLDPTWYVYPSGGHTLKPTHWMELPNV